MKPWCCFIEEDVPVLREDGWELSSVGCPREAEWLLVDGTTVDGYTHACTEHVGPLLTDVEETRVYPLRAVEEVEK